MRLRFVPYQWRLGFFAAMELLLYLLYGHHDADFHWFLHFFVGASAALIAMAIFAHRSGRVARFPLLWTFTGHVIALFPDILWNFRLIPHQPWMDVFLLHITSHFIPGRNWTWYAVFLFSLALYFYARAAAEQKKVSAMTGDHRIRFDVDYETVHSTIRESPVSTVDRSTQSNFDH